MRVECCGQKALCLLFKGDEKDSDVGVYPSGNSPQAIYKECSGLCGTSFQWHFTCARYVL